ncbi:MAG: bifunctional anthranilate synthase component I family protein/class IV aminotransferase [Clostridiales bacterium]|nr:bifunctional anthranilate synthase component I family protein/class IV aminotransferase [Clostridiales bacterium]
MPRLPHGARRLLSRLTLRLNPSSERGWFGGEHVCASNPLTVTEDVPLAYAASALEDAFEGRGEAGLVAVLAAYDGRATVLSYRQPSCPCECSCVPESRHVGVSAPATTRARAPRAPLVLGASFSADARAYRAGVRAVREAIAAGDVYVLNLTHELIGVAALSPAETYAALLDRASAEMAAYLETPTLTVASVSPERFVRVRRTGSERVAEIWPIKGTRPRGADLVSDAAAASELAQSVKERAEHVMVVDMERNDLGRVCVPGSVAVSPLFEVVPTPYCHQMVSRVHGVLRTGVSIPELLEATFPCGSVTGAPKRAAMRIASHLESGPRGIYTGALLVARPGEIDSSVLIRTAVCSDGAVSWGTGAGITIDSSPAEEYLETLLKASPLTGDGTPPVSLRETCRVVDRRVPLLSYHLARLAAGGCGPSVLARVRACAAETLAPLGTIERCRLGITVCPDGSVGIELSDAPSSLDVPGGPELALVTVITAELPVLPPGSAKPAERTAWDAAQKAAGPGAQAVLVTPEGRVIDGATATVWIVVGGELLTPPMSFAVAGVAREVVFDIAGEIGAPAREAEITSRDLEGADEVFFTNALAGVVSARGRGGPVAERLSTAFELLMRP